MLALICISNLGKTHYLRGFALIWEKLPDLLANTTPSLACIIIAAFDLWHICNLALLNVIHSTKDTASSLDELEFILGKDMVCQMTLSVMGGYWGQDSVNIRMVSYMFQYSARTLYARLACLSFRSLNNGISCMRYRDALYTLYSSMDPQTLPRMPYIYQTPDVCLSPHTVAIGRHVFFLWGSLFRLGVDWIP